MKTLIALTIAFAASLYLTDTGRAEEVETSLTSVVATSSMFSPEACATSCADTCTDTACPPESSCCLDNYLCDETWLDSLKNQKTFFSDDFTYSAGGTIRHRFMDEANRLRPGVPPQGARTSYNLWRFDPYLSLSYKDLVTGYVQAINANAFGYDPPLGPVAIDINEWDLQRYYVDFNLGEVGNGNLNYRYGRQYLIYGAQHLLSNLGWGNTFRNFEGHRFFYKTDTWNVDGFAMNSVNGAAGGSNFSPTAHDREDRDRMLNGIYMTYSGLENNTFDYYWIWSFERNRNLQRQDGNRHTIGMRWAGTRAVSGSGPNDIGKWNWDFEGAYQFGQDSYGNAINANVQAGFFSAIGGYTFSNLPWSPSINGLFWWGSGDSNPNDNKITTVNTLYPLGHAWWGLIDNLDGQNLLDYSLQASIKPYKMVSLASAFHWFDRANVNDGVYNAAGASLAQGAPGKSIGNELDLVATYTLTPQMNVQVGYFWFWYGSAIQNGAPRPDASQFYAQTIIGF